MVPNLDVDKALMHKNSIRIMRHFVKRYVRGENLTILDVGSRVLNSRRLGSYRDLFRQESWKYVGIDILGGENVDVVVSDGRFPFRDGEIDVVASGSTFEHVEYPWQLMREIARVMRQGGLCCIVAPFGGGEHRIPFDTYRYFPDGMVALAKWGGLEVVKTAMFHEDTYLVARKP